MKRTFLSLLLLLLYTSTSLLAQDGNNPLSYPNLALQFSGSNINGDAASGFIPSVAISNGFGSYLDNPASVALIENNYFSFGMVNNTMNQQSSYLNNSIDVNKNESILGNLGVVYTVPTTQGTFVIGGGYNLNVNQNRINQLNGRNNQSTITDYFKESNSGYFDIAYETYAIDWGDVDSTYRESIFRIGFTPDEYPGINQDAQISYTTNIGEYSVFFGTEFQKNLLIGLSAGLTHGNYTYRRDFLEFDGNNDYNGNFIDGSDIDNILVHDEIDATILGLSVRAGAIYKIGSKFNVGVSYLFPSNLQISEYYFSSIETNLDDGSQPFYDDTGDKFLDEYQYIIHKPGKLNIGFAVDDLNGFSISTAAEFINYSSTALDIVSNGDFENYMEKREYQKKQNALNDAMEEDYKSVINLKAGVKYQLFDELELRAGYAFLPGRSKVFVADKNVFGAGLGARLSQNIILDVSAQYAAWNDKSEAYSYFDSNGQFQQEMISENIAKWNIFAGIKFLF